jgi:translation elongation factor EF-1alpha
MEEEVGKITHFFSHLNVGIIQVTHGTIKVGDKIHFKGHTTDFFQTIDSMQREHAAIAQAAKGESVGIKVKDPVREHDLVFKIIEDA